MLVYPLLLPLAPLLPNNKVCGMDKIRASHVYNMVGDGKWHDVFLETLVITQSIVTRDLFVILSVVFLCNPGSRASSSVVRSGASLKISRWALARSVRTRSKDDCYGSIEHVLALCWKWVQCWNRFLWSRAIRILGQGRGRCWDLSCLKMSAHGWLSRCVISPYFLAEKSATLKVYTWSILWYGIISALSPVFQV